VTVVLNGGKSQPERPAIYNFVLDDGPKDGVQSITTQQSWFWSREEYLDIDSHNGTAKTFSACTIGVKPKKYVVVLLASSMQPSSNNELPARELVH
jgi:hypothetical protein